MDETWCNSQQQILFICYIAALEISGDRNDRWNLEERGTIDLNRSNRRFCPSRGENPGISAISRSSGID